MVARHFFSRGQAGLAMTGLVAILSLDQVASAQPGGGVIAPPGRGAARDAITEQELRKEAASTAKAHTLMMQKTKPVDVHPDPQGSFLTSSLFLSDGQMFTVVPLGAVLNLPAAHRKHVVAKPEGTFTFWPNFLKQNGSWLSAKEVPLKMAKGDPDLAKAILRETSMDSHVVVSVYKGGPITVLEPTPEAKAEARAEKAAAADASASESKRGGKS